MYADRKFTNAKADLNLHLRINTNLSTSFSGQPAGNLSACPQYKTPSHNLKNRIKFVLFKGEARESWGDGII